MKSEPSASESFSFQTFFDGITDYVVAINRDYRIVMANHTFRNRFNVEPGLPCYQTWKKRDSKCDHCVVEQSFADGQIHRTRETVIRGDGRIAQLTIVSTPIFDNDGNIVHVLETATDLTEKRKLLDELNRVTGDTEARIAERLRHLSQSEEKYRAIFERSRDAIILTDPKGKILEINQAGLHILGHKTKYELLAFGSALTLFESEEELHAFQREIFREGFVDDFEARILNRDGNAFDALISSNVILDIVKTVLGYVVIIRDITERNRSQQKIERQNTRLATLNSISMTVNSTLNLTEVLNTTADKMLEILEMDSVRIYLLKEDKNVLELVAHKGLSEEFVRNEHVVRRGVGEGLLGETGLTGKTIAVDNLLRSDEPYADAIVKEGHRTTAYLPLISKGVPVGVMCVSSFSQIDFSNDYMEFLNAIGNQIGVAIHNADLYERMETAYEELKDAQEQVIRTEKLASLGKLSATIAHEINNPLAAVLTYARLMKKMVSLGRFTADRLPDIQNYLRTVEEETARCGEIVKNLLAFSRRSKMSVKAHDIEDIIDKTLLLIAHSLEMKSVQVVKDIHPDVPKINCDFRQMQQALLNLFSNAAEAMADGGTLTVRAGPSETKGFLHITVSDTGSGIPQEAIESIFEPFFTTKDEGKGVGLGLSVVYGIVTNHNGSIRVESRPEEGTTFHLKLPTEYTPPSGPMNAT
jgi:PAS domain S-box-containing protein